MYTTPVIVNQLESLTSWLMIDILLENMHKNISNATWSWMDCCVQMYKSITHIMSLQQVLSSVAILMFSTLFIFSGGSNYTCWAHYHVSLIWHYCHQARTLGQWFWCIIYHVPNRITWGYASWNDETNVVHFTGWYSILLSTSWLPCWSDRQAESGWLWVCEGWST